MCFRPPSLDSMAKKCPSCNTDCQPNDVTCPNCGANLPSSPTSAQAPGAPGAPGMPGVPGAPAAPGAPGAPRP